MHVCVWGREFAENCRPSSKPFFHAFRLESWDGGNWGGGSKRGKSGAPQGKLKGIQSSV